MNRLKAFVPLYGLFLLFLLPFTVLALDTMRCGTTFVEVGDTEYELLTECGEPTYVTDEGLVDELWIYEPGPESFRRIVTIRDGKIDRIEMDEKP